MYLSLRILFLNHYIESSEPFKLYLYASVVFNCIYNINIIVDSSILKNLKKTIFSNKIVFEIFYIDSFFFFYFQFVKMANLREREKGWKK